MIIRSASNAIEFNTSSVEKNHPLPYLYMVEDELNMYLYQCWMDGGLL